METNSISDIGSDIASQMLDALVNETQDIFTPMEVPLDEQKKYIKRHSDMLSIDDKKTIGSIIIMDGMKSALKFCNEGTVINIDSLDTNIIKKIYEFVLYKTTQ